MRVTTVRVCVAADRKTLVEPGSPESGFVFAGKGAEIPDADAGLKNVDAFFDPVAEQPKPRRSFTKRRVDGTATITGVSAPAPVGKVKAHVSA